MEEFGEKKISEYDFIVRAISRSFARPPIKESIPSTVASIRPLEITLTVIR
jgi:hypothetical protein